MCSLHIYVHVKLQSTQKTGDISYVHSKQVYGFCLHIVCPHHPYLENRSSDGHIPVCKYLKRHALYQTYYGMCGAVLAHFSAVDSML